MADSAQTGNEQKLTQPETKMSIDLATILGIVGALGLVAAAIILGGSPGAFIDIPSILIVIGGTIGVTVACFSFKDVLTAFSSLGQMFFRTTTDPHESALQQLQLAQIARFRGVLALQNYMVSLEDQPLLQQGLSMAIDGSNGDEIERVIEQDIEAAAERAAVSVSVFKKAADLSPAMGLIGTLVGLVQMLGNLEDPNSIGPAMAVALLTTFYGALLSNVVFTPLAAKLERTSSEDMLLSNLYRMTSASVGRQENPRRLEMLLNTVLPPSLRVDYFN
ncbi:motility protein A [Curvivirga aplysinae]|uniref:motility protein A n=1 Tax=Curvivirga aplysinae TaxID=2529852 RepID=UPI0012BC2CC2|nr:MotA/TolQ/ExbB proton channel family protein [Curvivirga aplysinae]MTI08566.1 flagellar motor protein MotA [Curvivirga aplysinae]